eukprot:SAG11_NODE_15304_length_582_cov_1.318841_1_plen_95_part_00
MELLISPHTHPTCSLMRWLVGGTRGAPLAPSQTQPRPSGSRFYRDYGTGSIVSAIIQWDGTIPILSSGPAVQAVRHGAPPLTEHRLESGTICDY